MKASDLIQLLEYGKAFKEPKAKRSNNKELNVTEIDIAALIQKKLNEAALLEKILSDREKANKKEDKKPEGLSVLRISELLMGTFPITGLLYLIWLRPIFHG